MPYPPAARTTSRAGKNVVPRYGRPDRLSDGIRTYPARRRHIDFGLRQPSQPDHRTAGLSLRLDIAADEGVRIGAFADGTVREIGESSYGNYLIVDHDDGFSTLYAHRSSISAKVGDSVSCGRKSHASARPATRPARTCTLSLWKDGAALTHPIT